MKRASLTGICVLGLTMAVACNRGADDDLSQGPIQDEQSSARIAVSGCLTSEGDRFVLTQLNEGGAPVASTEMYQLTNADDDLRPHVGHTVEVVGEAPPPSIAQLRQTQRRPVGTSGEEQAEPDGADPQVSTSQTTRFETRSLRVLSVLPTEQPCVSSRPASP